MDLLRKDINRIRQVMYEQETPQLPPTPHLLNKSKVSKNRLVLNFPNRNKIEVKGAHIAKSAKLVTDVFKNESEAIKWLDENHETLSKPLDTLIFGTHGSRNKNSITVIKNEWSLFEKVKSLGLVGSNTKVFFTACWGARKTFKLIEVADFFGVPVYAAEGTYNFVTNSADLFIKVDPKNLQTVVKDYENKLKVSYNHDEDTFFDGEDQLRFALTNGYVQKISRPPIKWFNII